MSCCYFVIWVQPYTHVFGHMRIAKAQIHTAWSGPSFSINGSIGYWRMYEWRAKDRMILCARAGCSESWSRNIKAAMSENVISDTCALGQPRMQSLLMRTTKTEPSVPLRKHAYSNILKILPPKIENFQIKNPDIFHTSAQNIDCRYSLEPPRRGGSNEYPQSMFWAEIRKIMYTPVNPSFTI